MKTYKCADCGNTYDGTDRVQVYRVEGVIVCELCREDREERGA